MNNIVRTNNKRIINSLKINSFNNKIYINKQTKVYNNSV